MLFDREGRRLWICESLSSSALSDGFFGDCLLDAEVKLVGESHAGTVDLAQDVKVLFVLVPVQDEVSSPDKRYFLLVQSFLDKINLGKEEVDKVLPFFGFIVGVLGSREEGGGEGVCVLSGTTKMGLVPTIRILISPSLIRGRNFISTNIPWSPMMYLSQKSM